MKKIFILLSIISLPFLYGQQTPAKNQTQDIVISYLLDLKSENINSPFKSVAVPINFKN